VSGLLAPAKLTWSLHVTGVRSDGLHLLDAEMVSLDLADTVELTETAEETSVVVTAAYPASPPDALVGDDDLVRRALRLVGRRAHVEVVKRIPIGAGLGGGSADAAAVLRWAGVTDPARAVTLGSDVPFCVVGGRAAVRGVGEIVEPLEPLARTITHALPAFRVDTAACYRAFDSLGPRERLHPRNDLSRAAELVAPELGDVRRLLEERADAGFVLAGSGSTLYCEGDPMGLGQGMGEVVETKSGPIRLLVARTRDAAWG
jgi:4-diphosphocytidyl-2-C-methyl-D-erythritol kinase